MTASAVLAALIIAALTGIGLIGYLTSPDFRSVVFALWSEAWSFGASAWSFADAREAVPRWAIAAGIITAATFGEGWRHLNAQWRKTRSPTSTSSKAVIGGNIPVDGLEFHVRWVQMATVSTHFQADGPFCAQCHVRMHKGGPREIYRCSDQSCTKTKLDQGQETLFGSGTVAALRKRAESMVERNSTRREPASREPK